MSIFWNSPFHNTPTFTFTDKGLFPVGSVVTTRKDLTGFDAEVYNLRIGEQYIVDKCNQWGVMYLLNLDGTPCEWQLGGGSTANCFEPVLEWQQVPTESLTSLKVGDKIKIGDEENVVANDANPTGFLVRWQYKDFKNHMSTCFAYGCGYTDNLIPVYKQVPKMVDLTQLKQTTLGETTMKTTFTKADLKTGHRITTRNGQVWTVLKGIPSQTGVDNTEEQKEGIFVNSGWMDIYGLDDKLEYTDSLEYSVEKVELVQNYYQYLAKTASTTILWERKAPKSKEQIVYDEAVEATESARQAYELAQKKLEALNPAKKA